MQTSGLAALQVKMPALTTAPKSRPTPSVSVSVTMPVVWELATVAESVYEMVSPIATLVAPVVFANVTVGSATGVSVSQAPTQVGLSSPVPTTALDTNVVAVALTVAV
ncbi:protein of unknown function [uncultured Sphingopyxis sp.]|uniref:Uncharacterized protein n=1 Tax=uncultured Sphingopyxis sp. TaxID=310581 RepID=A0A1Y5PYM4_9SPHN|nr:protein of unknown function [uncultured Sphingopyxis sp.]